MYRIPCPQPASDWSTRRTRFGVSSAPHAVEGKVRAKVLTAEERHERARQAAEARWARRKPR